MSAQRQYTDYHAINAGVMTGVAVLTGDLDVKNGTSVSVQLIWTGTPTGTFAFLVSNDGGTTWSTVTLDKTLTNPSGSASNSYGQLNVCAAAKVRIQYTNSGSTGVLDAYIVMKGE